MTRRKKTSRRSNPKRGFPYRKSDEKALEEGERVGRAQYHHDMRSFAKEILEDARKQFETYDEAREYIDERIHEDADGMQRVIYTHKAIQTLVYSDRWDAIEDDYGMDVSGWPSGPGGGLAGLVTVAAFFAVRQDITEYVDAMKDEYFED